MSVACRSHCGPPARVPSVPRLVQRAISSHTHRMDDTPKAPRARVRRVRDAEPLVLTPPRLKLRAFTECFDRGSGVPALVIRADLVGDRLLVSITGREM